MWDLYPYSNFHELNQDWILSMIKKFENELKQAIDYKTIHYADPLQWNITTQYAPNTVVVDKNTGIAYISKDAVPSGILLSDKNYWIVIFDYQKIYNKIMSGVAFNEKDNETASKDLLVNDLVWYHGDLYRVTRAISEGSKYIVGTNLVATTIESLLSNYYGRDRVSQLINDTLNISGDYTVNAGDIAETASNLTLHSTHDMLLDADGKLTEQVAGNREVDVDGDDSIHVDGISSVNIGGTRSEIYGNSRNVGVTGVNTEEYHDTMKETFDNKHIVNGIDETNIFSGNISTKANKFSFESTSKEMIIKFPDKQVNLYTVGEEQKRNFWFIGDSYGTTYHPDTQTYTNGWCQYLVKDLMPSFPFINNAYEDNLGGAGFSGGSSIFSTLMSEWIKKYDDITDVVICAGRNDFFDTAENINKGMQNAANVVKEKFPNARLYVGMIGYDLNETEIANNKFYSTISTTINYKNGAANYGYTYLTNVEAILHNRDLMRKDDGKHPNENGGKKLAAGIFQALMGCCNVGYPLRACDITINNGTITGKINEWLNNTTINLLNGDGLHISFNTTQNILCNPFNTTVLIGTVDFKYFNGYEYGISRIECQYVINVAGKYYTASGYISFEGKNFYIAILKINAELSDYETLAINAIDIMPFNYQFTF